MEWTLQQQGFDLCYDKRLYDRLVHDDAESVRGHLQADAAYQERLDPVHRESRRTARGGDVRAREGARGSGRDVHAPGRPAVSRRPARGSPDAHPRVPLARARRAGGRRPAIVLRATAARDRRIRPPRRRLAAVRLHRMARQRLLPPARRVVLGVSALAPSCRRQSLRRAGPGACPRPLERRAARGPVDAA